MTSFKKHYLYRYIREDTDKVFYIGIGTKHSDIFYTLKQEYRRAYNIHSRNLYFKNIIKKTKYRVEILLESNDYSFIKNKEIEFIKLYKDSLCNITDGGEGSSGRILSAKERANLSARMSGVKNPSAKQVINVVTNKIYPTIISASLDYKGSHYTLSDKISGKRRNDTDFIILEDFKRGVRPVKSYNKVKRKVIDLDSSVVFNSLKECAMYFNVSTSYICNILKGKVKSIKKRINIKYYE